MRKAAAQKVPQGAGTSVPLYIPAPIGGLNTRDPPALVPITEMTSCANVWPTTTGVISRNGFADHVTGLASPAETLMVYTAANGAETMFAAVGTAFYDVTAAGALGAAVVSGLTNAVWQYVNFTNSSGTTYLCAFNGVDSPRYWNGSAWTTITGVSTPSITGLTTSTIISAAVHQRRMWLVQTNSLKAWYLPVDSVGGAAQALDLGGIAYMGGYIMAIESWTVDGGTGVDDYLVCVTSKGQMVVFAGIDPSSASTWTHVGTWNVAPPVGRRALYKFQSDLLVMTSSGILSTTKVFRGDSSTNGMLSAKISQSYLTAYESAALSSPASLARWQLLYFPGADMLIWSFGTGCFAMNTNTGAWSGSMVGSYCWALLNQSPYFAAWITNNNINKFWGTSSDDGLTIQAQFTTGYSDFGSPGVVKKAVMIRGGIETAPGPTIRLAMAATPDFVPRSNAVYTTYGFSDGLEGMGPWIMLNRVGVSFSIFYAVQQIGITTYTGCYLVYNPGGLMGSVNFQQ